MFIGLSREVVEDGFSHIAVYRNCRSICFPFLFFLFFFTKEYLKGIR